MSTVRRTTASPRSVEVVAAVPHKSRCPLCPRRGAMTRAVDAGLFKQFPGRCDATATGECERVRVYVYAMYQPAVSSIDVIFIRRSLCNPGLGRLGQCAAMHPRLHCRTQTRAGQSERPCRAGARTEMQGLRERAHYLTSTRQSLHAPLLQVWLTPRVNAQTAHDVTSSGPSSSCPPSSSSEELSP
jgi:hypothetical protein